MHIERKHVKNTAKFVVGMSVSFVASNVLRNNTSQPENTFQKVQLKVGSAAIGAMVAELADEWTGKKVDQIADGIAEAKAKNSEK